MSVKKIIGQQVDWLTLYAMNRRLPQNGAARFECPVTLEEVLAQTHIVEDNIPPYQLTSPGEHSIHLETRMGEITCKIKVRPSADVSAPLLLYHHGLAEVPYTSTWNRLFPANKPCPAHTVAVQAPFHTNMVQPMRVGFATVEHIYQMLAGSLRIMQYVQEQFEREGAAFTMVSGVSWGGITSLLYEGLFGTTRATVPLFASPKLSQVIWDAAQLFGRELPVSHAELDALLDFTPIYERIDKQQIYPVLGEHDLFFRLQNHAMVYKESSLVTLPVTHVGAIWASNGMTRKHLLDTLAWAGSQAH
ncbi:MAG: hypothetical protein ACK2U0_10755 [Candidatus Promineifilaceae bacterium]|jgi:hypothetical protein